MAGDVGRRLEALRSRSLRRRGVGEGATQVVEQQAHRHRFRALLQNAGIADRHVVVVVDEKLDVDRLLGRGKLAIELAEESRPVDQPLDVPKFAARQAFSVEQVLELRGAWNFGGPGLEIDLHRQVPADHLARPVPQHGEARPDRRDRLADRRERCRAHRADRKLATAGERIAGLRPPFDGAEGVRLERPAGSEKQGSGDGREPCGG